MTEELEFLNGSEAINRIKEFPLFQNTQKKPFSVKYIKGESLEKNESCEHFINFNFLVNELRRLENCLDENSDRQQARLLRVDLVNFAKMDLNASKVLLLSNILPQIIRLNSKLNK